MLTVNFLVITDTMVYNETMTVPTATEWTMAACTPATTDYIDLTIKHHNDIRANHSANPLVWDDDLSCIAQRHVESCIAEHLM